MRTRDEVIFNFTPIAKLSEGQRMRLMKLEMAFKDVATEMWDLVPDGPDKTVAFRKLLETKFICAQAVTHTQDPALKGSSTDGVAKKNEEKESKKESKAV